MASITEERALNPYASPAAPPAASTNKPKKSAVKEGSALVGLMVIVSGLVVGGIGLGSGNMRWGQAGLGLFIAGVALVCLFGSSTYRCDRCRETQLIIGGARARFCPLCGKLLAAQR